MGFILVGGVVLFLYIYYRKKNGLGAPAWLSNGFRPGLLRKHEGEKKAEKSVSSDNKTPKLLTQKELLKIQKGFDKGERRMFSRFLKSNFTTQYYVVCFEWDKRDPAYLNVYMNHELGGKTLISRSKVYLQALRELMNKNVVTLFPRTAQTHECDFAMRSEVPAGSIEVIESEETSSTLVAVSSSDIAQFVQVVDHMLEHDDKDSVEPNILSQIDEFLEETLDRK